MKRHLRQSRYDLVAILCVTLFLMLGCAPHLSNQPQSSLPSAAEPHAGSAPDFELSTLAGGSLRLSDHFGKRVVAIEFWSTSCAPCHAALIHLDELFRKYKNQGFVVLGVSIDGPDSAAQVSVEAAKMRLAFPILLDSETQALALYNTRASVPYGVLIARDGSIVARREGYAAGDASLIEYEVRTALQRGR